MDSEQSGEVVEGSEASQQETVTENEVASKVETTLEVEKPESDQVNGHAEVENTVGTEEAEKTEEKNEENLPKEDPKMELAPSDSSDKADPEAGAGKEAETNQPKQEEPVAAPENETVSVPEPATVQEPTEVQPPKEEEKVVEKVEPKVGTKAEKEDAGNAGEPDKPAGEEEKKEDQSEKATEGGKEAEKSDRAGAEAATTAAAEGGKSEEKEPEEDPTPAAGTLAFAILEQDNTKGALITTRTLVVLRGLPGSGKSFLSRAIAEAYKDQCSVVCADDHGVKPESASSSGDGYKALDEAIVGRCSADTSPVLIVVDDTNHTQDRLAHLGRIAKQHKLVTVFLEPRTEWRRDPALLTKKTKRGLEQAKVEAMKVPFEETSIPLYFGWFLFFTLHDKVRETSMNFLKTLATLENFKKHLNDFSGKEEKEVDLEQYFKAKVSLHCTTKFTNYGKTEGAKEYAEKQAVKDLYGSVSDLSLSALFVTPRTVGARVSLTEDQLQLWPEDGEKEAEPMVPGASSLPRGSRAHVTLGCAEGVQAVQTGYDLLQILLLQKGDQQGEEASEVVKEVEEIDPGTLTYYGKGRWYLALKEPISAAACFSSVYKAKAPGQPKKEKKKQKCTIL